MSLGFLMKTEGNQGCYLSGLDKPSSNFQSIPKVQGWDLKKECLQTVGGRLICAISVILCDFMILH